MSSITFTVYGTPRTKGSFLPFSGKDGKARMRPSNSAAQEQWTTNVRTAAVAAVETLPRAFAGPLAVRVSFLLTRPQSHYRTGRFRELLRADAPTHPITKNTGDIDKLLRGLLDPLTGLVFSDDAQVVRVEADKQWVDRYHGLMAGATVRITELNLPTTEEDLTQGYRKRES